jgi:tyrosine-specific transport protein
MLSRQFGSTLIIIGAGIGAGMVGIPIATGSLGFFLSSIMIVVCWAVMSMTASLILHVNLAFHERSHFSTMTRATTGRIGRVVFLSCYLMMFYSLIAAYIAGGSSLFGISLNRIFHTNILASLNTLLFTIALSVFVYFGTQSIDYATRILVSVKMGTILFVILFLSFHIRADHFLDYSITTSSWLKAWPILLTAFGYHSIIPSLRDYLHSDSILLKRVLFIGGLIPLIVYLLWNAVIIGVVPGIHFDMRLTEVIGAIAQNIQKPFLGFMIHIFINIALITSFLSVSIGFLHFICDIFHLNENNSQEKCIAMLLTFLPPLGFVWIYPEGFLFALNYAGLFSVILFLVFPVLMTWRLKQKKIPSSYPLKMGWVKVFASLSLGVCAILGFFLN